MLCQMCGDEFNGLHSKQRYCSKECREAFYVQYQKEYKETQTKSIVIERVVYKMKPRKQIETDEDQLKIKKAIADKHALPPGPVKQYQPGTPEWDEVLKTITPLNRISHYDKLVDFANHRHIASKVYYQ